MGVTTRFKRDIASSSANMTIEASTFEALLYSTGWIDESTQREDFDFVLDGADSSASVANYELASSPATGYARQTLAGITITDVDARDAIDIDATDVTFGSVSSSAGVAGGMLIYWELAATDSSGRIVSTYYDFASPVTPNGGDITVQFSTAGWLELISSTSDAG